MRKYRVVSLERLVFAGLWLLCVTAQGKSFTTEYIEFQLPVGWECSLEGTEWVCQSESKGRKREAIIIMAAKQKGDQDGIEQYYAYLKEKKQYVLPNRKTQVSVPKYTKKTMVNKHPWVDSLHLASEVPGFYTRYMATIKGDLGIAVTFSVSKDHYDSYQQVFQKVIESMRVFAVTKGQLAKTLGIKRKRQDLLSDAGLLDSAILNSPRVGGQEVRKNQDGIGGDFFFYILLVVAAVGFIIYKKRMG